MSLDRKIDAVHRIQPKEILSTSLQLSSLSRLTSSTGLRFRQIFRLCTQGGRQCMRIVAGFTFKRNFASRISPYDAPFGGSSLK
ncbi:hypothetical protein AM571_PA00130 (plasmid) [Rhizobium etli 8C-3]|uniref:Uncharacterized protein n=1 Tax=Rhizobium etli 8C-3 TaxID=538025 RepID=A0A1L5PA00_RHIET|nr:hypothetical protein AM571_PA00130 [Rhizobium etli 8C-3]